MNYYDTILSCIQTPTLITMRGLPLDPTILAQAGLVPVEYPYPAYNADLHSLEPDGDPQPNADGSAYVQGFIVVPLPLEEAQKNLKTRVTARRWEAETGGLALPDGTRIATDVDDQNRIASAMQGMSKAGMAEVDFKADSGWVRLTADQLSGVAAAIAGHVQACFSRERALHELVDAAPDVDALAAVDVNTGWPGQEDLEERPKRPEHPTEPSPEAAIAPDTSDTGPAVKATA